MTKIRVKITRDQLENQCLMGFAWYSYNIPGPDVPNTKWPFMRFPEECYIDLDPEQVDCDHQRTAEEFIDQERKKVAEWAAFKAEYTHENKRLREALEFYADRENYKIDSRVDWGSKLDNDKGKVATEALSLSSHTQGKELKDKLGE